MDEQIQIGQQRNEELHIHERQQAPQTSTMFEHSVEESEHI